MGVSAFWGQMVMGRLPCDCVDGGVSGCRLRDGALGAIGFARDLRARELVSYSIADDAGNVYRRDPSDWEWDECADGWDGEPWEADYDE